MRILYTCFLISAMLASEGAAVAQIVRSGTKSTSDRPVSSIAISPQQDSVNAGSAVLINVTLTNISDHAVAVTRMLSGADSQIDVRDVNGKSAPDTPNFGFFRNGHATHAEIDAAMNDPARLATAELADNLTGDTVQAGRTVTWSINVARFYDMSQPGKYSIRISRGDPEDLGAFVKSNTVTVTVTPRP